MNSFSFLFLFSTTDSFFLQGFDENRGSCSFERVNWTPICDVCSGIFFFFLLFSFQDAFSFFFSSLIKSLFDININFF